MKKGKLYLVSVGPGTADLIPPMAKKALQESEEIIGYALYFNWIQDWIEGKKTHSPPLTQERERAQLAIDLARSGKIVSLVSSGDIGVYAMATLAFDLMSEEEEFSVQVIPGISAANACASILGAPLSHDFATLSLSDLLCPWEWIERRAQHIAQADLAVVFYNVQSKTRQTGVYQIIKIMQEHKSPQTQCGIVRNAYREDQSVRFCTLEELSHQKFDMLTSIVIGNRFSKRKGNFLYTPRGYQQWEQATSLQGSNLPQKAVWVFSGTKDGNLIADTLYQKGVPVVISVATDYGKQHLQQQYPHLSVVSGKIGKEKRGQLLQQLSAKAIVDATHPFSRKMSQQLMGLSKETSIPYVRYERESIIQQDSIILCKNMEEAAKKALQQGSRIFLSTGVNDLSTFLNTEQKNETTWFVRITPNPDSLNKAFDAGIPSSQICAMQGPFSTEMNVRLWTDWKIDCVVSKDSGEVGGFREKIAAAQQLGIPLVIVQRPAVDYTVVFNTIEEIVANFDEL